MISLWKTTILGLLLKAKCPYKDLDKHIKTDKTTCQFFVLQKAPFRMPFISEFTISRSLSLKFQALIVSLDQPHLEHQSSNHDISDSLGKLLLHEYYLSFGITLPSYPIQEPIIHEEGLNIQNILINVQIYLEFVSL